MRIRTYYHPKQDNRRRSLKRLLALAVCIGLGIGLWFGLRALQIKHVTCRFGSSTCDAADQARVSALIGTFVFVTHKLESPGKLYQITTQFPNTLIVMVRAQSVIATFFVDDVTTQPHVLLSDGSVITDLDQIARLQPQAQPKFILPDPALISIPTIETLVRFARAIPVQKIVIFDANHIELTLRQPLIAIVSQDNIVTELRSLQLLLSSPTIEQKQASVDMRFAHPVLRYF